MSRYVVKLGEDEEFVYGFDHAVGYFYEIWDYKNGEEDHEHIIEDKSHLFNKITKTEMLEVMEKYNADPEHIQKVAMDLPF